MSSTKISNPLHLLILSPAPSARSTLPPFLHALTGAPAPSDLETYAGYTSHPPVQLRTKYFEADLGVWVDEVPPSTHERADTAPAEQATSSTEKEKPSKDGNPTPPTAEAESKPSLSGWQTSMLSAEASEVRNAIGGIVINHPLPLLNTSQHSSLLNLVSTIAEVRDVTEADRGGDCAAVLVLHAPGKVDHDKEVEAWEERLLERGALGWDVVVWDGDISKSPASTKGEGEDKASRNEYGEATGIARVIEVLEAQEWSSGEVNDELDLDFLSDDDDGDDEGEDLAQDKDGSGFDPSRLESTMPGMSTSLVTGEELDPNMMQTKKQKVKTGSEDQELQVEELQGLMERIIGIREMGADMPEEQKRKFAKKAMGQLMKDI